MPAEIIGSRFRRLLISMDAEYILAPGLFPRFLHAAAGPHSKGLPAETKMLISQSETDMLG